MIAWQYLVTGILVGLSVGLILGFWRACYWHYKKTGKWISDETKQSEANNAKDK